MMSLYTRPHRGSIYEPATIHDIPQEVLERSLMYLLPSNFYLLLAGETCRAWRPVAQQIFHSQGLIHWGCLESMICGFHLKSLVFGSSSIGISNLTLDVKVDKDGTHMIGKEYIPLLSRLFAPTLNSLELISNEEHEEDEEMSGDFSHCYNILESFFYRCKGIRILRLINHKFGDNSASITTSIVDGFRRLKQLDLIEC
jgi:hypothetical protein